MMKRRRFVEAVSGSLLTLSGGAIAQPRKAPRIGCGCSSAGLEPPARCSLLKEGIRRRQT